ERFALPLEARALLGAELVTVGLQSLTNVIDLLVKVLKVGLASSELSLQFVRGLFAFRGGDDGLAHVEDANFGGGRRTHGWRRLRSEGGSTGKARRGERGR